MRRRGWIVAALLLSIVASGCERGEREERARERTNLPVINERIEREADQGSRPETPPATEPGREVGSPREPGQSR